MKPRPLSPVVFYGTALGIVVLDQIVKAWTTAALPVGGAFPVVPGIFQILHTQNRGMAFSLLDRTPFAMLLLAFAAFVVIGAIVYTERRLGANLTPVFGIALALPLGGAVGNLIDRLRQGYVTDMFDVRWIHFPVFNVADAAITFGVLMLIYLNLFAREGTESKDTAAAPTQAA